MKKMMASVAAASIALTIGSAVASADAEKVEVKLTIGRGEAVVGGQTLAVKAPVIVDNSTLVPLRVISAAFASDPMWLPDTQGIVLTYGDKTIELTIDSVVSTVNGEARSIPSAPKLIDGTTMVPVRFISETFGADVNFQEAGGVQSIVITGSLAPAADAPEDEPVIDGDEGKTRIGDSHWGWSMDYPTGLVQDYQELSGEWVYFSDANGEYGIEIEADVTQPKMKVSGLLAALTDSIYDGTILDKQLVQDGPVPYARIVSRSSYGTYLEDRLYLKDGVLFWYSFEIFDEANYKNQAKLRVYRDLIDSFELTFDADDEGTKDISSVKDGHVQHTDEVYGLTLELPASWTTSSDTTGINFYAAEEDLSMYFTMTSLEQGDTLEAWASRREKFFTQELLPAYREIVKLPDAEVDGDRALVRIWSALDSATETWSDTYDVFVMKGDYKYNFSFSYEKENREKYRETIERLIGSIAIDESVAEDNFGYLDDPTDVSLDETVEVVNETYGYSMTIPAYWEESYYNYDDSSIGYEYRGGSFTVSVEEDRTFDDVVDEQEAYLLFMQEYNDDVKIENTTETFKGVKTKKIVIETDDEYSGQMRLTMYIFEKKKVVYKIEIEEYESSRTPENIKRMEDAVKSFTFE